jgi:oxaloacetate decarboxylase beta subunit
MIALSLFLAYLAIAKKFEPLLLLPIAVGMLLTNLPGASMFHSELFMTEKMDFAAVISGGGLIDFLYLV